MQRSKWDTADFLFAMDAENAWSQRPGTTAKAILSADTTSVPAAKISWRKSSMHTSREKTKTLRSASSL